MNFRLDHDALAYAQAYADARGISLGVAVSELIRKASGTLNAPARERRKPKPKFGTLKGKVKLLDPHVFDPMTDEEADAWVQGR